MALELAAAQFVFDQRDSIALVASQMVVLRFLPGRQPLIWCMRTE